MENTLVYGENLDRGSFISGLSKNLVSGPTRLVKNVVIVSTHIVVSVLA
jgi:hypothetical protein